MGRVRVLGCRSTDRMRQLKRTLDRATLARADLSHGRLIFDRGLRLLPQALRSWRRDRSRSYRLGARQPRLPAREHHRPECHGQCRLPDGGRGDARRPGFERTDQVAVPAHGHAADADRGGDARSIRGRGLAPSPSSLMPDGLLDTLSPPEICDLIAYLAHPTRSACPRCRGGAVHKQNNK